MVVVVVVVVVLVVVIVGASNAGRGDETCAIYLSPSPIDQR